MTRLFFATDLHGSERAFRKFVNAAKFYDVDVLILGGDLVGKLMVPILRRADGRLEAKYGGRTHVVETPTEKNELEQQLGLCGAYYRVMDEEEYRALAGDWTAIRELFYTLARERLEQWFAFAEERLRGTGVRCCWMGGNDDAPDILDVVARAESDVMQPCEERVVMLDAQHTMISLGFSTPTPWHTPREISEAEIGARIEAMMAQVPDPSRCVMNLHDPPVNSSLDVCAKVDNGDPPRLVLKGGRPVMHNAGSTAVREAIVMHQPMLSLHGHIHESPGTVRIGRSLAVNPGSEYAEGVLRGVIATIENGKLKGHQLTAG